MRYPLIPIRLGYHQKEHKNVGEDVEKGNPFTLLVECKLVQPLWKTAWRFLKTLKLELPYASAIPHLGMHLEKKKKKANSKRYMYPCIPVFIAALFTIFKVFKKPKCTSTDEWIKKVWCVYIHIHAYSGILFSHKKRTFAICSNMDRLGGHYVK